MEYIFIFLFVLVAAGFVFGGLFASRFISKPKPGAIKQSPYECGIETSGPSWVQFNVGYYLFALLFLIFDVEAAFLFPWAVAFRDLGWIGLIEIAVFMLILLSGLAYAWKKGVLKWV